MTGYVMGLHYGPRLRDNMIGLYYGIISWDYITELEYGIILRNYITESYHGIILRNYITGSYCGITLRNYILGLYYGIVLRNHITESYYRFIVRNYPYAKVTGGPQGVPGATWNLQDPPGHAPGTHQGRAWDPQRHLGTPADHKNNHISTDSECKKLSVAASESFRCNASFQRLPWTALPCIH